MWKKNEAGVIEIKDGHPVMTVDGADVVFNPDEFKKGYEDKLTASEQRIKDAENRAEALKKGYEDKLTASEQRIKDAENRRAVGAGDDVAARLEAMRSDAGTKQAVIDQLRGQIADMTIGEKFTGAKLLSDRTILTPDVAKLIFGQAFRLEDVNGIQTPVGYANGVRIMSKTDAEKPAGFDEALEILWEKYPHRDAYTKKTPGGPLIRSGIGNQAAPDIAAQIREAQKAGDWAMVSSLRRNR